MSKERKPKLTRLERIMRLPIHIGCHNPRICYSATATLRACCKVLRKQDNEKLGTAKLPSHA